MMKSLFNDEIPDVPPKESKGKYAVWKKVNWYRKSDGDKRCANCKYFYRTYHDKAYFKCELLGQSNSEATDIRASYVCNQFRKG